MMTLTKRGAAPNRHLHPVWALGFLFHLSVQGIRWALRSTKEGSMKPSLYITFTALTIVALGCSAARSTSLQVHGPAGTPFTVQYKAGALSGTVSSTTKPEGPSMVLDLSLRGQEFECDISKGNRAASLTAELAQGGKSVFRAEAPAGTQGVRILRGPSGWRQETYWRYESESRTSGCTLAIASRLHHAPRQRRPLLWSADRPRPLASASVESPGFARHTTACALCRTIIMFG